MHDHHLKLYNLQTLKNIYIYIAKVLALHFIPVPSVSCLLLSCSPTWFDFYGT